MNDTLLALEPRDTEDLLGELATRTRLALSGEAVRKPFVTLLLARTSPISGFVVAIKETRRGSQVLVHAPGDDRSNQNFDMLYLPLASIEAVLVHDGIDLDAAAADAPPLASPLDLKRRAAALGETLGVKRQTSFEVLLPVPIDIAQLEPLDALLRLVTEVLTEIEPAALAAKVKQVRLEVSDTRRVVLEGDVLVIATVKATIKRYFRASLTEAIEAVL